MKCTYTHLEKNYSGADNLYKILRKCSRSINPLGVMVILFGALLISSPTISSDWQSCTKLVTWCCEWQCRLKYTLFIMMRLCEYSTLLCILFAEGVTSWKAEWLWNNCCCVQQMWLGHSSHFPIFQVFRAFVLHWGATPTKQNQCQNSSQLQQNCLSWSFLKKQEIFGYKTSSVES